MSRDYSDKSTHQRDLPWNAAVDFVNSGWLIAREGWVVRNQFVFFVTDATYTAKDLTTGQLEPFLALKHPDGKIAPWLPTLEDVQADDWLALNRQVLTHKTPEPKGRLRREGEPFTVPVEIEDFKF